MFIFRITCERGSATSTVLRTKLHAFLWKHDFRVPAKPLKPKALNRSWSMKFCSINYVGEVT
jgi:hypothetical protein